MLCTRRTSSLNDAQRSSLTSDATIALQTFSREPIYLFGHLLLDITSEVMPDADSKADPLRTAKDLLAGAAGGVAQVLLGRFSRCC